MAKRKKQATTAAPVIEKNQRGMSWAGEVTLSIALLIVFLVSVAAWGVYWSVTTMFDLMIEVYGRGFTVGLIAVIPLAVAGAGLFALLSKVAFWIDHWSAASRVHHAQAQQAELQAGFVQMGDNGLLPVDQRFLNTAEGNAQALQLAMAAQRAKWTVADVPTSLNYSPRYNNRQTWDGSNAPTEQPALTAAAQAPGFWHLYNSRQLPEHGFLMGYSLEDGSAVNADWSKLYSALIGGLSGSGKSTLIRSILAQSALQGGRFLVLDPHYGAGAESLGQSLQPLRHLMLADVAGNDKAMLDSIAYIRDIGQRRLTGRDQDKTPVVLIVDETTALLQRSAAAEPLADALGEIAQETRKVGVYAMCIGQNFHSDVMGTTVRDSFVSFISCRARRNVARTMTDDNEFGKAASALTVGQAVWMTPAGELWRLSVPNCTAHDLELVAQHTKNGSGTGNSATYALPLGTTGSGTGSNEVPHWFQMAEPAPIRNHGGTSDGTTAEPATELPLEPGKLARIETMLADGAGINEIIRGVFGVDKKGRAWMTARQELRQAMEYLGGNHER